MTSAALGQVKGISCHSAGFLSVTKQMIGPPDWGNLLRSPSLSERSSFQAPRSVCFFGLSEPHGVLECMAIATKTALMPLSFRVQHGIRDATTSPSPTTAVVPKPVSTEVLRSSKGRRVGRPGFRQGKRLPVDQSGSWAECKVRTAEQSAIGPCPSLSRRFLLLHPLPRQPPKPPQLNQVPLEPATVMLRFWKVWRGFEVQHGNEDTSKAQTPMATCLMSCATREIELP